jgi:peptidoglycan/LPS O-acetylase OafA/YrhL
MVLSLAIRAPWFRETLRYSLQGLALVPIFVVAIRYPDFLPMRLLNVPVMRFLGLLSYSLYLCHQVILFALDYRVFPAQPLITAVVTFPLSVLFSWGVHRFIERPSARARKAFVTTPWLRAGLPSMAREPAQ